MSFKASYCSSRYSVWLPAWTCLSNWSLHYLPQIVKLLPSPPWAWSSCEKDEDISRNVLITTYFQIAPSLLNVALSWTLNSFSLTSLVPHSLFFLTFNHFFLHMLPGFLFHALSFCLLQVFLSISTKCGVITEPSHHVAVYYNLLVHRNWWYSES